MGQGVSEYQTWGKRMNEKGWDQRIPYVQPGRRQHKAVLFKVARHKNYLRSLLKMQIPSSTVAATLTLLV